MKRVKLLSESEMSLLSTRRPYRPAQAGEEMAAMSSRPLWLTIWAAMAVFSQTVIFTSLRVLRNAEHWPMACSWLTISRMEERVAPGRATSRWSILRRRLLTMEKR